MRWEDERQSDNVDDLRGDGGGGGGFGGGGLGGLLGLLPLILSMPGGIVIVLIIAAIFFAGPLLGLGGGGSSPTPNPTQAPPSRSSSGFQGQQEAAQGGQAPVSSDENIRFVRAVAAYTEDTWKEVFQQAGRTYTPPRIEIYSKGHQTGCGFGQAAMGPFYCPRDRKVWLDLAFFDELSGRFGAPGRFAEAYVIAHEVGHHVQTLLGTTQRVDSERQNLSRAEANPLSVRTELQADCYAGVWAQVTNRRQSFIEPGDIEGGLRAAAAVGDDTLQQETQGRVVPDSFTHGSSAQRMRWFKAGYATGDIGSCDTFTPDYGSL